MNYLSVCSGIEAASVAWHPLGWRPVAFSEIEKFPSAVLAHHWPDVPNLGDMTKFNEWNIKPIDLLVGGTPCQSFSVAGLRKGLEDPRGNLALTFLAMADRFRPSWVVWENVPGVLSDRTNAFGQFLTGLGELGYEYAYRVLDAQYYGVPQRRRRVFVVANSRGVHPAQVLFEPESLCRDLTPSREAGEGSAGGACPSLNAVSGQLVPQIANPLTARMHKGINTTLDEGQTPIPVAFQQNTRDEVRLMGGDGQIVGALAAEAGMKQQNYVAFDRQSGGDARGLDPRPTAQLQRSQVPAVATSMQVRRLTPTECERLQGFPDGHTRIPWRNKPASECPDGPRYKALGNSMAVPVMRWIGERIQEVTK